MKLVAQMVGRNEADRFLPEVLEHLRKVADEIVFTDDCSDDDTMTLAKDYGCHTYQTPEPLFTKHEGQLRQFAWNNLTNHAELGDWILAIDCDEKLWSMNPNKPLSLLMSQQAYDVLAITFYHMWNENQYRVDKLWRPNISSRMFRFQQGGKFADRKLACGSEPTYVQTAIRARRFLTDTALVMQHLGYVRDEDKKSKFERYSTLDGGDFHALAHINSIMDQDPTLVDWKTQ